jgi:hypothetical protein
MDLPKINIEIQNKLQKILPGIAEYYADAFNLLSVPDLSSKTHIISHLFREILSALEAVLETIYPSKEQSKGDSKHIQKVEHFISSFKKTNLESSEFWRKIASDTNFQLAKKAHRYAFEKPRIFDNSYIEYFIHFNSLLGYILENIEVSYLRYLSEIKSLLKMETPDETAADKFKNKIPNSIYLRQYFFGNASNQWLTPLSKRDFFKNPPPRIQTENGFQYPLWSESFYLSRIAADSPEEVCNIILNIPETDNPRIHFNYFQAAEKMPTKLMVKLLEYEKKWLKNARHFLYLDNSLVMVINRLFLEKKAPLALECMEYILNLFEKDDKTSGYRFHRVEAKLSAWEYQKFIGQIKDNGIASAGIDFLNAFIKMLDQYFILYKTTEESPRDNTYISRQDIDHSRFGQGDLYDIIIDTIIDVSKKIIKDDPEKLDTIYGLLIKQRWNVFYRIAYYLLEQFDKDEMAFEVIIENIEDKLTNPGTWNEIARLLKKLALRIIPC